MTRSYSNSSPNHKSVVLRAGVHAIADPRWLQPQRMLDACIAAATGGVVVVQLRLKSWADADRISLGRAVVRAVHPLGCRVLVNDRPDLCRYIGADGVHLGDDDVPVAVARAWLGDGSIIGRTARHRSAAQLAESEGADYVGVGPAYATRTKTMKHPTLGVAGVADVVGAGLPVVAVGGITVAAVRALVQAGVRGCAVAEDLWSAYDVVARARELQRAFLSGETSA